MYFYYIFSFIIKSKIQDQIVCNYAYTSEFMAVLLLLVYIIRLCFIVCFTN